MRHIEKGYCTGSVIRITDCNAININQCDLIGCGAYGLIANNTNIFLNKTIIRDCSYGIMKIRGGMNIRFKNCEFFVMNKITMVYINETSENILFNNCRFAQNKGLLFDFR